MARRTHVMAGAAALMVLLAPVPQAAAQMPGAPEGAAGAPEAVTGPGSSGQAGPAGEAGPEVTGGPGESGEAALMPPREEMEGMRARMMERMGDRPGMPHAYGMRGGGGTGRAMMGHGMMMRMMFALMDADGDGSLSREEWLEGQERIFNHLDREGDGEVTMEDMRAFMTGRGFGTSPAGVEPDAEVEEGEDEAN